MADKEKYTENEINLTGYAIIKYTAIVIIVLAILVFIAVYILPLVRLAISK